MWETVKKHEPSIVISLIVVFWVSFYNLWWFRWFDFVFWRFLCKNIWLHFSLLKAMFRLSFRTKRFYFRYHKLMAILATELWSLQFIALLPTNHGARPRALYHIYYSCRDWQLKKRLQSRLFHASSQGLTISTKMG